MFKQSAFGSLLLIIIFSMQSLSQKKIPYKLPVKDFLVTVTYTITDIKVFKKESVEIKRNYSILTIEDPIKIEGKMRFSDETYFYDFSKLGRGGRSFEMIFNFDGEGNNTISSFNGVQEPATAEIIEGSVGILGGALDIISKNLIPVNGFNLSQEEETSVVTKHKIEIQKLLIVNGNLSQEITLDLLSADKNYKVPLSKTDPTKTIDSYNFINKTPSVLIALSKIISSSTGEVKNNNNSNSETGLFYKVPDSYLLTATVKNNLAVKEYVIIDQVVFIPQTGLLKQLPVELVKGKRSLEISFNPLTGNLSKYSLKKESSLKKSLSQVKTSMDELSTKIKSLEESVKTSKEDKSVQNEIDLLKLEIERLRLIKEKTKLLEDDPTESN